MHRSVKVTNKLHSVQRKVAKAITGGLSTTAGDILDVHSFILPIYKEGDNVRGNVDIG
jgi:hypothetical protein